MPIRLRPATFINIFTPNKLCIRSLSAFGFLTKFRIVCNGAEKLQLLGGSAWQLERVVYK